MSFSKVSFIKLRNVAVTLEVTGSLIKIPEFGKSDFCTLACYIYQFIVLILVLLLLEWFFQNMAGSSVLLYTPKL